MNGTSKGVKKSVSFKNMIGVNAFEWDFLDLYGYSIDEKVLQYMYFNIPGILIIYYNLIEQKFSAITSIFHQVRHYLGK